LGNGNGNDVEQQSIAGNGATALAMGQWGNGNCVYVSLQEKTLCIKVTESLQNVCTASIHDFHPSNKTATIVVHNVPVFLP
jgi:hypothetical protein